MSQHSNKTDEEIYTRKLHDIKKNFDEKVKYLSDADKKIAKVEIQKIIDGSLIMSQNKELLKELLRDFHV